MIMSTCEIEGRSRSEPYWYWDMKMKRKIKGSGEVTTTAIMEPLVLRLLFVAVPYLLFF